MKNQCLDSNVGKAHTWGKEGGPPAGLGSQAPPGREGAYSHGHRPQQLQDALPVPLLGCVELLSADANNLRPRDKMPWCVNGHSSHPPRRSATQALSVPPPAMGLRAGPVSGAGSLRRSCLAGVWMGPQCGTEA